MAKKTMFNKIWGSRILWVIIALACALLLWVYVTSTEGDDYEETFDNVQVVFRGEETLREAQGLIVTELSHSTVSVTLRGYRRVIANLRASDIQAVIDLSTITRPGTSAGYLYAIAYTEDIDTSSVTVERRNPATVSFTVDRLSTNAVPVQGVFQGSVAEGYVADASDMVFEPANIRISGPEEEVSQVARALVIIDRQELDSSINTEIGYTLVDADGNAVDMGSMTVDVDTVNVTFPVKAVKTVPLTLDIVAGGGAAESNVKMECDPAEIQISGDASLLESINRISLGSLDLTEFAVTFERTYTIPLPNDVVNESGVTEAKVTITLSGLATKRLSVTNIVATNVPAGCTAEVTTRSIDVTIRAPEDVIDEIDSSNLRAVLDLTDYAGSTGQFTVPATIRVDGFTEAGAVYNDYSALVLIGTS